jgi:hypothetical protein
LKVSRLLTRSIIVLLPLMLACSRDASDRQTVADTAAAARAPAVAPSALPPAPSVDSGAHRLLPRDEADSSFHAFRAQLLASLSRHDTTFLYSILAPQIKNSFGGDDSLSGFKRIWNMDSRDTHVWSALTRALQMGGKLADSTFIAPYVYAFWPDSIDAFSYVAVTNNAAPVRAAPDPAAPVTGTASYSILKLEDWKNLAESGVATDSTWARVKLPDGRTVWLASRDVYSPISWRAFFEKRNGRWLMTIFVAGD